MSGDLPVRVGVSEADRQRVTEVLAHHFSEDRLELEEYERRLELVERAESAEALSVLVADLAPASRQDALVASGPVVALARLEEVPPEASVVAVFSNVTRTREWTPPRALKVVSVFGNTELDFRQARLAPGVTSVRVKAVFGNVHLVVPPGVWVELHGTGVFGNFEDSRGGSGDEASPCTLRVTGTAVFGNAEVEERLPGESGFQAWKRRRRERKALSAARTPGSEPRRLGPGNQ